MSGLKLTVVVILCVLIVPLSGAAGDFDGSKPVICAVIETVECGAGAECQKGAARAIDIPRFLTINFNENMISGKSDDGKLRTTKIQNMKRIDGKLILQGIQNGKAWSMVIMEKTGDMTISTSDEQVGFIVFGACTAK
jgi:hypothetical protein